MAKLAQLHEQRILVQSVLEDETITKPGVETWKLREDLIAVLSPLAKAVRVMYGELHDH